MHSPATERNHFYPGDKINMGWRPYLYLDSGTTINEVHQYKYDATLYLSDDTNLDVTNDLKLFSLECFLPIGDNACGMGVSIQCVYAENNQNTLSCTTYPDDRINGLKDLVVDTTAFIDVLPKDVNVIFKACLKEDPTNCAEAVPR